MNKRLWQQLKVVRILEQSEVLSKILSPESADMCWSIDIPDLPTLLAYPITDCDNKGNKIPTWSLTALLSVIPNYKLSSEHNKHTCTAVTSFGKETVGWFNNPIDACVWMIIKLHKLNFL